MLPLVSRSDMRSIDAAAIGADAETGLRYMERAARALAQQAMQMLPRCDTAVVAVVCGKGNNGGDGYLAAAYLREQGYRAVCYALCVPDNLTGEAHMAAELFCAQGGAIVTVKGAGQLEELGRAGLIIDAVLGTGFSGNPQGIAADAIEAMNNSAVPILAADTPSGLDGDSGLPATPCVRAAATVTMGFIKTGMLFYPGRELTGALSVADLGYPRDCQPRSTLRLSYVERSDITPLLPPRRPGGSKFDHGVVSLVSGSQGMCGATTLAAMGALRCGCGMVHAWVPRSLTAPLSIKVTEAVIHELGETPDGTLSLKGEGTIRAALPRSRVLCIGPGLSHHPETAELVRRVVATSPVPVVLDADGLNAYRDCSTELARHTAPLVLTPHRGEWERLFGSLPCDPLDSFAALYDAARAVEGIIVLKGGPTCIATPAGEGYVIDTGTSALATAGTGDILAGVIASFIAQGSSPLEATLAAVFVHGLAGRTAARSRGEHGTIASDVVDALPAAVLELLDPALAPSPNRARHP